MIRKTIIVVLTLAAMGTGVLWAVSHIKLRMGHARRLEWLGQMGITEGHPQWDYYQHTLATGKWLEDLIWWTFPLGKQRSGTVQLHDGNIRIFSRPPAEYQKFRWVDVRWAFAGFEYGFQEVPIADPPPRFHEVATPLWAPLIAFSAYPAIAFIRGPVRRWRRRRKGLCLRCGYNLTGNVSGICPECGKQIG